MKRTGILFVIALAIALIAGVYAGEVAYAEPTPGTQVHLPILTWLGDEADACDVVIEVQNVGNDFTKAAILFWGAPGACPPQCNGPFKVECSGLLKPGSTWNFIGPQSPAQVPAGAKKGIVFSLSAEQDGGDIFADAVCEYLFSTVRQDCDAYRRFKKAFDEGETIAGFDFDEFKGEPLAVEVVRKCQTASMDAPIVSAYSGIAGPMLGAADPVFGGGQTGYMFYAPLLYADQDGLNSYIYIQNAGLECTSVEIWLKQQGECIRSVIDEIPALAPGETIQYNVSDLLGPFWQGNAWIRTSVPAAIVVDNWSEEVLMTYNGKPAELNFTFDPNAAFFTQGSQVNYAPLIYREHQGWNTNIQVQNLSSVVNAKVKVYFIDNSGDIIKTVVDWICPRGTQTFPLAVIDGLRGNWVGQARVESQEWWSPGDPKVLPPNIVSVAELIRWNGPEQTVLLEGVAYNLFPEQQAFDWQLGSGKGGLESGVGLIGIPSFLNNISGGGETGLATELAITNLVPKPGFTDFAIYIYDQNGLLDFVCEKLNEKQVEYINVADDWNYINDGFKGSAVISAVFWEHPVIEESLFPGVARLKRNLVGLAAVKIERFNWPQVPSTDPADDAPGDQASASEGFPIRGPWNYDTYEGFDFEGPQVPPCPGVGEDICTATVQILVTEDGTLGGTPVAGALVQLRSGDQPIATGVTNELGLAVISRVPVGEPPLDVAVYDIFVQEDPSDELEDTGRDITLVRLDGICGTILPVVVVPPNLPQCKIEGFVFSDGGGGFGNGFVDPSDPRWADIKVIAFDDGGDDLDDDTTNENGKFELEVDCGTNVHLKAQFTDSGGNTVSIESPSFLLDDDYNASDEQPLLDVDFDADTGDISPLDAGWIEPGGGVVNGPDDPAVIQGTVFIEPASPPPDTDGNCIFDPSASNESPLAGVTVKLFRFDGALTLLDETTTDSNGVFTLTNPRDAGFELLWVDIPGGQQFSPPFIKNDQDYNGPDTAGSQRPNYVVHSNPDKQDTNKWCEPGSRDNPVNGP